MTKYEIILYWSGEDEAFIAEVPELAGCAARRFYSPGSPRKCRNRHRGMAGDRPGTEPPHPRTAG
jgi:hypothetical protein